MNNNIESYKGYVIQEVENIIHNQDSDLWTAVLLVLDPNNDERIIVLSDDKQQNMTWENMISTFDEMGLHITLDDLEPSFDTYGNDGIGSNDKYYTLRS